MCVQYITTYKKDGPFKIVKTVHRLDLNKPKCYRDHDEYRFNKEIVHQESFSKESCPGYKQH